MNVDTVHVLIFIGSVEFILHKIDRWTFKAAMTFKLSYR